MITLRRRRMRHDRPTTASRQRHDRANGHSGLMNDILSSVISSCNRCYHCLVCMVCNFNSHSSTKFRRCRPLATSHRDPLHRCGDAAECDSRGYSHNCGLWWPSHPFSYLSRSPRAVIVMLLGHRHNTMVTLSYPSSPCRDGKNGR